MSDLYNDFPSWGEEGEYPSSGFFYSGGDQVNEKHLDALWNGVQEHIDNLNSAIRNRVADIGGDVILDGGLSVSTNGNVREVDVAASSEGAYVDGQFTGSVTSDTFILPTNDGSSTRTDSIWVDTAGQVGYTTGTTTVSDTRHKVAEVDVATDDTISAVRNTGRHVVRQFSSEFYDEHQVPGGLQPGDIWFDKSNNRIQVYQNGSWQTVATEEDEVTISGGDGLKNGNSISIVNGGTLSLDVEPSDFSGNGLQDDGSDNLEIDPSTNQDWTGSHTFSERTTHSGGIEDASGNQIDNFVGENLEIVNNAIQASPGMSAQQKEQFNDLYRALAETQTELSMDKIDYSDGDYDIYVDDDRISQLVDVILEGSGENARAALDLVFKIWYGSNASNELSETTDIVNSVTFSPDGNYIAYGSDDQNVYIHTATDWSLDTTLSEATSTVYSVTFSPDGNYIAYGGYDDNVYTHTQINTGEVTDGTVEHVQRSFDFVPTTVVLSDEVDLNGGTREYVLEDGDGNTVTITGTDIDTEVNTGFTSSDVFVTVNIHQDSTNNGVPKVYDWAAYYDN